MSNYIYIKNTLKDRKVFRFLFLLILVFYFSIGNIYGQYNNYEKNNLYQPQKLPFVGAKLNGQHFNIMLAKTDFQKAKGFMFYKEIASNTGMLFVYKKPHKMSFWMMNTRIPLDLIFFSKDLIVTEYIKNMEPGFGKKASELPHYDSVQDAQYALELKAGSIDYFKIKIGDKLEIPWALLYSDY